jgi:AcrR family transcriptional regulator
MTPRHYSSPTREADAKRTRARIVAAASVLFDRLGYAATTMPAIAEEAGVSVQSVRLAGTKPGLLIAAFEVSFAGDEGGHALHERPEIAEIAARADLDDALAGWLDYVAAANARTAGLSRAMVTAAETDAVAATVVADLDARRRRDLRFAADQLVERGLLRAADAATAADQLDFTIGPEAYAFFVRRCGWSPKRYRSWLDDEMRGMIARWAAQADSR